MNPTTTTHTDRHVAAKRIRQTVAADRTPAFVQVLDDPSFNPGPHRWALRCLSHGDVHTCRTLAEAKAQAPRTTEWCAGCNNNVAGLTPWAYVVARFEPGGSGTVARILEPIEDSPRWFKLTGFGGNTFNAREDQLEVIDLRPQRH